MFENRFVRTCFVFLLMIGVAFSATAGGQQEAEDVSQVEMEPQPRQYISPQASDGTQDVMQLPFDFVPAGDAVPVGYRLTVYNNDGDAVYVQQERTTEERNFFERLLNQPKPQVELPESFTWDGTYQNSQQGSDGEAVPEGDYTYQVSIRDDQGEVVTTPPFGVTVDNTAPSVQAFPPPEYNIFSPNDDGIRDTVTLRQRASREEAWTGSILNAEGDVVWQRTWENPTPNNPSQDVAPPEEFAWDGTYLNSDQGSDGETVPEGEYSYRLSATDRAGNETTQRAQYTLTMSLQAGNLQLAVQGNGIFSPNGDGNQDTLTFETTVMEPEGLDTWDMQIVSAEDPDDLVRRFSGTGSVPETITFDGENRRGRATADGTYRAQLSAQYVNGNIVESEPVEFRIDTQAPQARVQARTAPENTKPGAPFVFGGTDKPRVEFDVTLTEGEDWTAVVETPEDSMRGTLARYGFTGPEFSYTWDGTGPQGNEMPDGVYNLTLRARDEAGNLGTSNTVRVRKFTRDTPIGLEIDGDLVRANAGDENQTVTIRPQFEVAELIDEFLLEIKNDDGFVVRSLYKSAPFESFEWDGRNNAGDVLEEGNYTVDFQVIYYHGNKPEISSRGPIALKRGPTEEPKTPPDVRLAAEPVPFSPDGDGYQDTVQFELEANSTDPVQSWELEIVDPAGNLFRTFSGEGAPPQFIRWNGRAEDGELVQAASDYTAELTVTDENDLSDSAETRVTTDVLVFRDDQGRLLINVPSIHFAGFSADLFEVERSKLEQNLTTLRRLSEILKRFPEYGITVEGHAAHIFFEEGRQKRIEQEEVLLPLSQNRAQEVKEALIILGVERDRMDTRGVGGSNPVVPHSNREELWKNRRVVFILEAEDRGE